MHMNDFAENTTRFRATDRLTRPMSIVPVAFTLGLCALASLGDEPAPTSQPAARNALVLPIRDEINNITYDSVKRRLQPVEEGGIDAVVFEMDTPGGALGTTLEICQLIKNLRDEGIRTYAWINDKAYSAGTIIALATDGIIMTRNAYIGDCMPIMMGPEGASAIPEDIEGKVFSPLEAELRDSARRGGYDIAMVMSFIQPDIELFWVENTETQERRFVTADQRNHLFGVKPDQGLLKGLFGSSNDQKEKGKTPFISDEKSTKKWRYVKQAE